MPEDPRSFWRYAFVMRGSVTPRVLPRVAVFVGWSAAITYLNHIHPLIAISLGPLEVAGAALGLLLVLRTNAGHDRWWEGRKLWGGIVNQCRNLAMSALAYGPADVAWRRRFTLWTAAFAHVCRASLRGETKVPALNRLLGDTEAARITAAQHMPIFVSMELAKMTREARGRGELDDFAFLLVDRERALLIDHIGACERILATPIPFAFAVKIRRFIVIYLLLLPFALVDRIDWMTPLVTLIVAYPVLALDQIGLELQNPFATRSLSHLPLDAISTKIERNLLAAADVEPEETGA